MKLIALTILCFAIIGLHGHIPEFSATHFFEGTLRTTYISGGVTIREHFTREAKYYIYNVGNVNLAIRSGILQENGVETTFRRLFYVNGLNLTAIDEENSTCSLTQYLADDATRNSTQDPWGWLSWAIESPPNTFTALIQYESYNISYTLLISDSQPYRIDTTVEAGSLTLVRQINITKYTDEAPAFELFQVTGSCSQYQQLCSVCYSTAFGFVVNIPVLFCALLFLFLSTFY